MRPAFSSPMIQRHVVVMGLLYIIKMGQEDPRKMVEIYCTVSDLEIHPSMPASDWTKYQLRSSPWTKSFVPALRVVTIFPCAPGVFLRLAAVALTVTTWGRTESVVVNDG